MFVSRRCSPTELFGEWRIGHFPRGLRIALQTVLSETMQGLNDGFSKVPVHRLEYMAGSSSAPRGFPETSDVVKHGVA